MGLKCTYNCSFSAQDTELEPYGDVSGPGVLAGFLGTAWLAVGLVVVHYFVAFNPHENPFQMPGQATEDGRHFTANQIDVMVTHLTRQVCQYFSLSGRTWIPIWLKASERWHMAFEKSILNMCDIQLMTGLGILISGYANLRCGISAYHFQLIAHLAWFSTVTHLAGLSALRQHLHRRPVEKWGRLFFIVVLATMLLAAMFPTLFFNWAHDANQGSASFPGSNAICFFNAFRAIKWHKERHAYNTLYTAKNSHAFSSAIMSMILLILSLASLIFKAQDSVSHAAKSARKVISNVWKRYIRRLKNGEQISGLRGISVYWLLVSAIWGTIKLFMAKSSAYVDEDDWTFGQILPIFLLLGPLVTTAATFFEPQVQTCPPLTVTAEANETEGAGEALAPMRAFNRDDEYRSHPAQRLEMSHFRQQVENFIDRNYYDFATCPWMLPAVALAFLQILTATVLMFVHLVKERSDPSRVLTFAMRLRVAALRDGPVG
ncbi:hypothetical protein ACJZ2D_004293 [Fusarium nematophilum]